MKKIFAILFLGIIFAVFAAHYFYAEACSPGNKMERGVQEEGMPMMEQMSHHGMGMMERMHESGHHMWRHLMSLGLDEKQREEITDIKRRVEKEMIKKRADEHNARIELEDLLDNDPVDMKAVESKLKQIETVKTERNLSFLKAREEIKSKLTPAQRKEFKETLEMDPREWQKAGHRWHL